VLVNLIKEKERNPEEIKQFGEENYMNIETALYFYDRTFLIFSTCTSKKYFCNRDVMTNQKTEIGVVIL
jgi:hypothetical protein